MGLSDLNPHLYTVFSASPLVYRCRLLKYIKPAGVREAQQRPLRYTLAYNDECEAAQITLQHREGSEASCVQNEEQRLQPGPEHGARLSCGPTRIPCRLRKSICQSAGLEARFLGGLQLRTGCSPHDEGSEKRPCP